jgi:hypothetical protein
VLPAKRKAQSAKRKAQSAKQSLRSLLRSRAADSLITACFPPVDALTQQGGERTAYSALALAKRERERKALQAEGFAGRRLGRQHVHIIE